MIKINSILLIVSIVFMHFMIVRIAGFPLTIVPFTMAIFLVMHFKLVSNLRVLYLLLTLIFWPFIVYGVYVVTGGGVELLDFSKTFLLWVYASSALMIATFSTLKKTPDYSMAYIVALLVITLYSLAQVLFVYIADSTLLYNLFGSFSYMGHQNFSGGGSLYWSRSPGLYLEPSFNAFVMFFLMSIVLINRNVKNSVLVLCVGILGIFVTTSAVGMLAILGLIISLLIYRASYLKGKEVLLAITLLIILTVFWGSDIFSILSLSDRFSEIGREGASGYWRVIAPLLILFEVLAQYPFGIPLGQVESFIRPMGLIHGGGVGSSLDNGFYVLPFYFGWVGILIMLGVIIKFFMSIYQRNKEGIVFWWFIIASLQFSGGVFLPEFIFCLSLAVFEYRRVLCMKAFDSLTKGLCIAT